MRFGGDCYPDGVLTHGQVGVVREAHLDIHDVQDGDALIACRDPTLDQFLLPLIARLRSQTALERLTKPSAYFSSTT